MGRVHFGSAAHFFVIPGPRPALDKLDPESSAFGQSQATRTPVSVFSGAGITGVTAFHKAIKEKGA
jgi:hypothetical protein